MDKFETFLIALLKSVFNEYPYDKEKSKESFKKVKEKIEGENHGYQ